MADKDQMLQQKRKLLLAHRKHLIDKDQALHEQERRIRLLEECLRLATIHKFSASSEKVVFQSDLFDEAELEVALSDYEVQLPEQDQVRPRK